MGILDKLRNLFLQEVCAEKMGLLKEGQKIHGRHGRTYTISLVKQIKSSPEDGHPDGWEIQAQIDRKNRIIRIRKDMHPEDQYMYLLHEIIHDLVEDFESYDLTDEFYVTLFAGELYDCLRRNRLGFL